MQFNLVFTLKIRYRFLGFNSLLTLVKHSLQNDNHIELICSIRSSPWFEFFYSQLATGITLSYTLNTQSLKWSGQSIFD